jgi:hypothetical protein
MGFIGVGLMVLAAIVMTITLSTLPDEVSSFGFFGVMKNFL